MNNTKRIVIMAIFVIGMCVLAIAPALAYGEAVTIKGYSYGSDGVTPVWFDGLNITNTNSGIEYNQTTTPQVKAGPGLGYQNYYILTLTNGTHIDPGDTLSYYAVNGTRINNTAGFTWDGVSCFIEYNVTFPSQSGIANHVVISEIQADSTSGSGGADDDWIELYNPTNEDINLSAGNYRIEKAMTANDPTIVIVIGNLGYGTYPGGTTIPAHGFYLIARDDASSTLIDKADAIGNNSAFTWTGTGYTLYLGTAAISTDDDPDIVDKVGFGSATYSETSPAPAIPEGKTIQRKVNATLNESNLYGPAWDSDNNNADFFIQDSPNPTNHTTSSVDPMPPIPELNTLILFSTGLIALAGYFRLKRRNG